MKKIILFGTFCSIVLFSILSCSEEETSKLNESTKENSAMYQKETQEGSFEKLSFDSEEFINSNDWLKRNSFFGNSFNCNELYKVTSNLNDISYIGLDLNIENSNIDGYRIKNYVIFHKLSNGKKFIYLQRDIMIGNSQIVQFLDITNGNVMDYFLYNCTEDDYSSYQSKVDAGGGGPKHVCYKSFKSCYDNTKAGLVQSPTDEVLCDWLPCATMAYSFCALAYVDGYIQTASDFDPGDCTKIL